MGLRETALPSAFFRKVQFRFLSGIIKIGDVLYCFQKDAQIAITDGNKKTLNQYLKYPENCDTSLVRVYSYESLTTVEFLF